MSITITFKGDHRTNRKTTALMICKKALTEAGYIVADYPDGHLLMVSKPDLTVPKEKKV